MHHGAWRGANFARDLQLVVGRARGVYVHRMPIGLPGWRPWHDLRATLSTFAEPRPDAKPSRRCCRLKPKVALAKTWPGVPRLTIGPSP